MSTRGGDTSGYGEIQDAQAMVNGVNKLHIMIIRARDGYHDDVQFVASLKKCLATVTDLGSLLVGTYAFTAYHNAPSGLTQAHSYWDLIRSDGANGGWHIPPAVDAERHSYRDANGVTQVWPLPTNPQDYLDTYVLPQIEYLSDKMGQRPLFYSGPDLILNYLAPVLHDPKNKAILECRLWLAAYTNSTVGPSYWDRVKVYWPKWFLWQYKGDVNDWPGVTDLDLLRFPGTRAQLKACLADPSLPPPDYDPVYNPGGVVDPIPVPVVSYYALVLQTSTGLKLRSAAKRGTENAANILDPDFRPTAKVPLLGKPALDDGVTWAAMEWAGQPAYFALQDGERVYGHVVEEWK